jgi:hypothetical protein
MVIALLLIVQGPVFVHAQSAADSTRKADRKKAYTDRARAALADWLKSLAAKEFA